VKALGIGALLAGRLLAADFELAGRIVPETQASVSLHGATSPFESATLSDLRGRFRFRKLAQGAYTVAVFEPGRGEVRETVEVGPGSANAAGLVTITLRLDSAKVESADTRLRRATVSARELAMPPLARKEYQAAQKSLSRRDADAARAHLEHAVEVAPQFCAAWNELGTIAYQSRRYQDAERYFRRALEADAQAYEPLVNLGGVLLNLGKLDEALQHNLYAVLQRPNDALANSQLGMSYFLRGDPDSAMKYLTASKQLDPAHFSHPQLMLAEIHLRRNEREAAVSELRDFLNRHPDALEAPEVKAQIARLAAP
jgi:tetratricopeptide (TPR) repeat protein